MYKSIVECWFTTTFGQKAGKGVGRAVWDTKCLYLYNLLSCQALPGSLMTNYWDLRVFSGNTSKIIYRCDSLSQPSKLYLGMLCKLGKSHVKPVRTEEVFDKIISAKHRTDPVRDNPAILTSNLPAQWELQQLWKLVKQAFNKKDEISPVFSRLEQTLVFHKFSGLDCERTARLFVLNWSFISRLSLTLSLKLSLWYLCTRILCLVFSVCCSDKIIINYDLSQDILTR